MASEEDPKAHPETVIENVRNKATSEFISDMSREVTDAIQNRGRWNDKLTNLHKKRYGIRPDKTFPWPGASNLHLPLIDKTIRRVKPNFAGLVLNARPVASFEPEVARNQLDIDRARKAEQFFHWMVHNSVKDFRRNLIMGIDYMLEGGFLIFKVVWRHVTEDVSETFRISDMSSEEVAATQQIPDIDPVTGEPLVDPLTGQPVLRPMTDGELEGFFSARGQFDLSDEEDAEFVRAIVRAFKKGEKNVTRTIRRVVNSAPEMIAIDPRDIIVPADTTDVESATSITHRMWFNPIDLKKRERDGLYENVDDVMQALTSENADIEKGDIIQVKEDREGVNESSLKKLIEVWEVYTWFDLDGDGVEEKVIVTYQPDTEVVLRMVPLPYDHGMWPFVKIDFEVTDGRWYSPRGIAEMLVDLQTEMTAQHNAKIDRMIIQNSPTFKTRYGAIKNPGSFRWIPGQNIVLSQMSDFEPIQIPILDSSFQVEENVLRQWAEEYVGITDFGLANALSVRSEARTATEISQIRSISEQTFSLDAQVFQDGMQQVYMQMWALWNQFGPDEVYVRIMGEEFPTLITRADITGDFSIRPTGDPTTTNRGLEAQRAFQRFATLNGDPFIRQLELRKDYLEKDDARAAKLLVKTPEEIQQEIEAANQAQNGPVTLGQLAAAARQGAQQNGSRRVVG